MPDLHSALRPSGTPPPPPIEELALRANRRKRLRVFKATGAAVAVAAIAVSLGGLPGPSQSVTVADGVTVNDDATDSPANIADEPTSSTTSEPDVGSEQNAPVTTPPDPPPSTTKPDDTIQAADAESAAPSTSTGESDSATPDQSDTDTITGPRPRSAPGLQATVATTSTWEDGYCFQIDLVNDTADARIWSLTIDIDGTVATIWNAVVVDNEAGTSIFAGQDGHNITIEPGALTTFGACVDTE